MQYSGHLALHSLMRSRADVYCKQSIDPDMAAMRLRPIACDTIAMNKQMLIAWQLPETQIVGMQQGDIDANRVNWGLNRYPVE